MDLFDPPGEDPSEQACPAGEDSEPYGADSGSIASSSGKLPAPAVPQGMIYSSGSDLRLVLIQFDSARGHASLHPQARGNGSLWPPDTIIGTIDTHVHRLRLGVVFVQIN